MPWHASLMASTSRRHFAVVMLVIIALAVYGISRWQKTQSAIGMRESRSIASGVAPNDETVSPKSASAVPSETVSGQKSLVQLHAEFRESQRCLDERVTVRANLGNGSGTMPPHIPGCDELKSALRRLYESTRAAAQAGDLDAQMCYLMQIAGDRDTGFLLSDVEIAEYQSVAPQYVDAAFKRGDWRVVDLLGFHVVDLPGLFVQLEQWKDPLREYKAHHLLLLGAGDVDPQDPDYWLPALRVPESTLSAQEIRDSDAWAHEMYDKYFISQPRLLEEPRVCTAQDAS